MHTCHDLKELWDIPENSIEKSMRVLPFGKLRGKKTAVIGESGSDAPTQFNNVRTVDDCSF